MSLFNSLNKMGEKALEKLSQKYPNKFREIKMQSADADRLIKITEMSGIKNILQKYNTSRLYDPDEVIAYKSGGKGREIYTEMIDKDPHISACLNIRKLAIIGLNWKIKPYTKMGEREPSDDAIQYAKAIEIILNRMNNINANIKEILSAFEYGYSVGEIMYEINDDYVICQDILSRHPDRFRYNSDYELMLVEDNKEKVMPPEKFFQYTFNPRFNNPYGTSLLRSCYWPYFFKTNLIKFLIVHLERFGSPAVMGKYPSGFSQADKDNLEDGLKSLQSSSVGVIPDDSFVELLEASGTQTEFMAAIMFFNSEISKAIVGQKLAMDEGERSGSYALGKIHNTVREDIQEADSINLSYVFNDQLIKNLINYNFGEILEKPTFYIPFKQEEDALNKAQTFSVLADIGVKYPKKYIHDEFGVPMPQDNEEVYEKSIGFNPFSINNNNNDDDEDEENENNNRNFSSYKDRFNFESWIGVKPRKNAKQYDIATSLNLYDDLYYHINSIFIKLQADFLGKLDINTPIYGLVDQLVRNLFSDRDTALIGDMVGQTLDNTTKMFASRFGLGKLSERLSFQTFERIKNEYLEQNFYARGVLPNVAETFRKELRKRLPKWKDVGYDYNKMKKMLTDKFRDLKKWKTHMIAQTELSNAAHHAAFEMINSTGIEFDAYFLVDPGSCPICIDWASKNPYTVSEAKALGLPHIQCNDQWTFVVKELDPEELNRNTE